MFITALAIASLLLKEKKKSNDVIDVTDAELMMIGLAGLFWPMIIVLSILAYFAHYLGLAAKRINEFQD